mmetsp:Transcript_23797/g.33312  ORF Transcript_23797/g.33312 Transcript_23797/m.33312 type:complete len:284 (+) Transcript_23797:179-1030(+)
MVALSDGYWGPQDSSIDFCEESYAVTPYVAEFWNSISSLMYVYFGLYGVQKSVELGCRWVYPTMFATLALIGCGSTIFHGTMKWWGELWDELPMLLLGLLYLVALAEIHPVSSGTTGWYFYISVAAMLAGVVVAYMQFKVYEIFLHSFTVLIATAIIISLTSQSKHFKMKLLMYLMLAELGLARLFWALDHELCGSAGLIPYFHVIWHVLSCFAAYHYILYLLALRYEKLGHDSVFQKHHSVSELVHKFGKLRFQPFVDWDNFHNNEGCSFGSFHLAAQKALM